MIKWILFDLAGVVVEMYFGNKNQLVIDNHKVNPKSLYPLYDGKVYEKYMKGEASENEVIHDFMKRSDTSLKLEEIRFLLKENHEFIRGMPELIAKLKKHYKIACLTNEGRDWVQYKIDKLNLDKLFDIIIESNQLGVLKSSKEFFIKSLDLIKSRSDECVYIDDKPVNCIVAKEARITSIVFKNLEQLKKELVSLRISIS